MKKRYIVRRYLPDLNKEYVLEYEGSECSVCNERFENMANERIYEAMKGDIKSTVDKLCRFGNE